MLNPEKKAGMYYILYFCMKGQKVNISVAKNYFALITSLQLRTSKARIYKGPWPDMCFVTRAFLSWPLCTCRGTMFEPELFTNSNLIKQKKLFSVLNQSEIVWPILVAHSHIFFHNTGELRNRMQRLVYRLVLLPNNSAAFSWTIGKNCFLQLPAIIYSSFCPIVSNTPPVTSRTDGEPKLHGEMLLGTGTNGST